MNPAIVIVAPEHAAELTDEFGRYVRDYDLHTTTSRRRGRGRCRAEVVADGGQVAMYVAESQLPDGHVLEAFARWRAVVPTARRLVAAHWSHFLADAPALRGGLAKGKYDAFLLMPRGVRDEEFHTAVCELLSDWGSTVAAPEVETVRIVTPEPDALTSGHPGLPGPDGDAEPHLHPRQRAGARRARAGGRGPDLPGRRGRRPRGLLAAQRARRRHPRVRHADRHRPGCRRRRRGRRRRPGGARRGRLRVVGGADDRGPGVRGRRRAGRHVVDDPQLPRLPTRHLGDAARPARPQPGDPVRHPVLHGVVRHGPRGRAGRRAPPAAHRRRRHPGPCGRGLHRASPTASCACRRSRRSSAWASSTAAR